MLSKLPLPYPAGRVSVFITSLSTATSKPVIVTSPSIATGTPFKNLTEYSNISPASEAATVPLERSTFGAPASAESEDVLIVTSSETPLRVIVPVESLLLPRLITVSPSILVTTSTFEEPPDVKDAGAPVPLRTRTSLLASKPEMITFPSLAEVTDPLVAKATSYINVSASAVAVYRPAFALVPSVVEPPSVEPPSVEPPSSVGVVGVGLTAPPPPPPPPPHAARIRGSVIALKNPNLLRLTLTMLISLKLRSLSLTF